jgi:cytochrome c biogenesis protein CcdA/thiol-disulfide isomerase/thioredoxin
MIEGPFAIAFGAGLVATMNPCGFAMLPAYLSYFMGLNDDEETNRAASLRRALVIGGVMSGAFLLVFGVFGLVITAGFRTVIDWIPYIALGIGALIVVLGVAMLRGYELTVALPKAKRAKKGQGLRGVFGFGLSYGVASLSCTLPVFLAVVATQLTTASFVSGVATFVVYGVGMSIMLVGVTVALAFGKQSMVTRLRSSARYINRVSGAVLVIAGGYILWFWGTNLGRGADALGDQGAFRFVETLSQRATEIFGQNALLWGVILVAIIAAVVVYAFRGSDGEEEGTVETGGFRWRGSRIIAASVAALVLASATGVVVLRNVLGSSDSDTGPVAAAVAPRGPRAPSLAFPLFDGSTATFAAYEGVPLVVNFWASWCPSCVAEMAAAIRPVQEYAGDHVGFLGVNLQDSRTDALRLVEETGVQFDLAEDDGALYQELQGIGMPFTVFISAAGEVVEKHNGPLSRGQLEDKIRENFPDYGTSGPVVGDSDTAEPPIIEGGGPAPDGSEVIVDVDVELPPQLAGLRGWTTDFTRRTIDSLDELIAGIPVADPRDIIPPLDNPEFERVSEAAQWLDSREPGVLFVLDGDARFYPLRIMTFHEVVNDNFAGRPVVVTFCPLCNTAVVFDPVVNGETLRLGVSGLLRNSDLVMWDSSTETLWQQITGEGIVGELAGTQLQLLGSSLVRWGDFQSEFPAGTVLSRQTGFSRSYGQNPYRGYSSSDRPFLFDGDLDERFPALERVVGVTVDGRDKAYPFSFISQVGAVNDVVGDTPIVVFWGAPDTADALDTADITQGKSVGTGVAYHRTVNGTVLTFLANGADSFTDRETNTTWNLLGRATSGPLEGTQLDTVVHRNDFWFAWAAFNPDDPVFESRPAS